jgi:hypothetical protein
MHRHRLVITNVTNVAPAKEIRFDSFEHIFIRILRFVDSFQVCLQLWYTVVGDRERRMVYAIS